MDDPNEGVLVLTFNREHKTLHRYAFNLHPFEQRMILQKITPVVFDECNACEVEIAAQENKAASGEQAEEEKHD